MAPELIRLATLLCEIALKAMDGQTADQRKEMWDMYLADVKAWRAFWGIDPTPKP